MFHRVVSVCGHQQVLLHLLSSKKWEHPAWRRISRWVVPAGWWWVVTRVPMRWAGLTGDQSGPIVPLHSRPTAWPRHPGPNTLQPSHTPGGDPVGGIREQSECMFGENGDVGHFYIYRFHWAYKWQFGGGYTWYYLAFEFVLCGTVVVLGGSLCFWGRSR